MKRSDFRSTRSRRGFLLAMLTLLAACPLARTAEAQSIEWIRQIGSLPQSGWAQSVAVGSNGIYVGGTILSLAPSFDAYLNKYSSDGNLLWTRQFGASPISFPGGFIVPSVHVNGIVVDGTGVYIAGDTTGPLEGQTDSGRTDAFVKKYDFLGNVLWVREFGTSSDTYGLGLAQDSSGLYVAGYIRLGTALPGQGSAGGEDAFLRKYDRDGNELWTTQFGTSLDDRITSIAAQEDGIVVSGQSGVALLGQAGTRVVGFGRKYDRAGHEVWTRQLGDTGSDFAEALVIHGGAIYASGSTAINSNGTLVSGAFLAAYDFDGNNLWESLIQNPRAAHAITADPGGLYVWGEEVTPIPAPPFIDSHAQLRRFDFHGNLQWSWQIETATSSCGKGIAVDQSSVYVTGSLGCSSGGIVGYTAKLVRFPPFVSEGGVVNNASYAASPAAVAPGSIAAIFGTALNDGSTVMFSNIGSDGKLVTTLGGASVTINEIPAPMFYSTYGQLGVQIPFELAGQTSATVQVKVGDQLSAPKALALDSFAPGIFTLSQDGRGTAAALHQDGITPVSLTSPAHPNEVITLFATGLGALNPPLATGVRAGNNNLTATPTVSIDGITESAEFFGGAPGFVGLNQINVRIPANTRMSNTIPVFVSIGGKQSNTVSLPVGQ